MARRQQNSPISLFPFLAVLVCTMGALILLLLVTTRQIRHDQRAVLLPVAADPSASTVAAIPTVTPDPEENELLEAGDVTPEATLADTSPEDEQPPQRNYQAEMIEIDKQISDSESELAERKQQIATLETETATGTQQLKQLQSETEAVVRELQSLQATQQESELPDLVRRTADLAANRGQLQARMDEASRKLQQKQQELMSLSGQADAAEKRLFEQRSALVSLRKQIQTQKEQVTPSSGQKTKVAFSNSTGTTRTPIIIDVSEAGYEFLPTGVRITAQDMQGFPVRDNPLLSGVLTLHRHRSNGAINSQPYVLLLVRPNGSLPFYGAQRVFTEAGIHFGYELIEQEREFAVGLREDAEVRIVREALLEALNRRQRTYAMLQQATGTPVAPSGDPGPDSGQRRMVMRSDGRVMSAEEADRRPLEGRFYAGGEAPPRTLPPRTLPPRIRPPTAPGRTATVEDISGDSDQSGRSAGRFGERLSDQNQQGDEGRVAFESWLMQQKPEKFGGGLSDQPASERPGQRPDHQPGQLNAQVPARTPGVDGPPQSTPELDQRGEPSLEPSLDLFGSQPGSQPGTTSTLSKGGQPGTNEFPQASAAEQLTAGLPIGRASESGSGKPVDLTMIDPELLRLLKSEESERRERSTPVGITVFLDAEHMTIGQQPALYVTPDSLGSALSRLLQGISEEVAATRRNPQEPLLPIVKFVVSPGGEQLRIPLARELRKIGIPSASVIEITPYVTPADDAGRTTISDTFEYSVQAERMIR